MPPITPSASAASASSSLKPRSHTTSKRFVSRLTVPLQHMTSALLLRSTSALEDSVMSLVQLWTGNRGQLEDKRLHQLIAFAGDGRLLDGGSTSTELRQLLAAAQSERGSIPFLVEIPERLHGSRNSLQ